MHWSYASLCFELMVSSTKLNIVLNLTTFEDIPMKIYWHVSSNKSLTLTDKSFRIGNLVVIPGGLFLYFSCHFFFQSKIIKTVLEDVHSSCSNLLRFSFLWTNSLAHLVFFFSYYWSIPICVALCRFLTQIMFLTRYLGRTLLAAARAETSPGPAAAAAIVTGHNPLE